MVVNQIGPRGQAVIDNPPRRRADMQAIADRAAATGNFVIVGSYAEMTTGFTAKFGFSPYNGLHCFNTDSGETSVYNEATVQWEDVDPVRDPETSGVFTPSTGWAMGTGSQRLIRLGAHLADVYFSFQRTGAALNPGANGNLDNVTIGRLAITPVGGSQGLHGGYSGRLTQYMVDTTGLVQLTSAAPGNTIGTGDYLSATGKLFV